jgi:hypothetical protein
LFVLIAMLVGTVAAATPPPDRNEGTMSFVARPKLGAAVFELPSTVRWRSSPMDDGRFRIEVDAAVNAARVLANVAQLSARAINKDIPCGDLIKVQSASAKLVGPRTMSYNLRFHYAKRLCVGMTMQYPADVTCDARVTVGAAYSIVTVDVQGATAPPCRIAGTDPTVGGAVTSLVGSNIFKRHVIDVAQMLPKEFQGVAIEIRAIAFDMPPASPVLHVQGDGAMTAQQLALLMTRMNGVPTGGR